MRKPIIPSIYYTIILTLLFIGNTTAQQFSKKENAKQGWTTNNPFQTDVFVENLGQFNSWAKTSEPIKYAVNNSSRILFTQQGLTFKLKKTEKINENEPENNEMENEEEEWRNYKTEIIYVNMHWENCNPDAVMEVSEESKGYYTFGEKGYEDVKAKGYKKLLYKNLYNGIDVEYIIPEKGGIKYSLIIHPGADISQVKMKYTGDVYNIKTDENGNILIVTLAGIITDHAPVSYYENTKSVAEAVAAAFELKDNIVSFKLPTPDLPSGQASSQLQTLIIDPWTVTPNLDTNNVAYDITFDDLDNAYVSGGTPPFKIAKYSSGGAHIWTFSIPYVDWGSLGTGGSQDQRSYTKFCIIPQTGMIYLGEGMERNGWLGGAHYGPRIMKINNSGVLKFTTDTNNYQFSGTQELWVMFYNRCVGQFCGFGGGTTGPLNIMQTDTSLSVSSSSVHNFNIFTCADNDIACVVMDYNGDFYALMSSMYNPNGHLIKSPISSNYNLPTVFDVNSGYNFAEMFNTGIAGIDTVGTHTFQIIGGKRVYDLIKPISVRANALAVNPDYLYSYDGRTIKAWDKSMGGLLGSVIVNVADSGGYKRTHEGIAVDDCNNVYVGGNRKVTVYNFNGSSFTLKTTITTNISGEVYGVELDKFKNILYVCGHGFATATDAITCYSDNLKLTPTIGSCPGSASIAVTGGVPPYSYHWSYNNATTSSITNVPDGTYYVTVTDKSCIPLQGLDTVVITSNINLVLSNDVSICDGGSTTLTASGATGYTWSPATGLSPTTGASVTASPTTTTTYTVTGSTGGGCTDTKSVTVTVSNNVTISIDPASPTICQGESVQLTASGTSTYLWSDGMGTNNIITVSPTSTHTYTVSGSSSGCSGTGSTTVTVNANPGVIASASPPSLCLGGSSTLTAGGATTYIWGNPPGGTSSSVVVIPGSTTTYYVTGTSLGCTGTTTVTVTINNNLSPVISGPTSICTGNSSTLDAGSGYATYLWSTTASTQIITINTGGPYYVTVTDVNGCSGTTSVNITENSSLTPTITPPNICLGNTATLDAGSGYTTYAWSTSASTQTISVTTGGFYSVTVTDANGCSGSVSTNVTVEPNPVVTILASPPSVCTGSSSTLTAGGADTYVWGNGLGTANSITVLPLSTTTYTITGTITSSGCTGTSTTTVTVNSSLMPSIIGPTTLCTGATATLDAGSGYASYLWSTIASTQTITINTTGGYSVTVADANGCSGSASTSINPGSDLSLSVNPATPLVCQGTSVLLTAGSSGGTTNYTWNPPDGLSSQTGSVVIANPTTTITYTVTGSDASGCTGNTTVTITVNRVDASASVKNENCGQSNGAVFADTIGPCSQGYVYTWNTTPPLTTRTVNNLPAGTYTVTVTCGICYTTASATIVNLAGPSVSVSGIVNDTCGKLYGSATANPSGGTPPYSVRWNTTPPQDSVTLINVSAGTFNVLVTDSNNCTATNSVTITNIQGPVALTSAVSEYCYKGDGMAIVEASGGSGTYSYLWNTVPPQTKDTATGLTAGTYTVTVNDGNCTTTDSVVVTNDPGFEAGFIVQPDIIIDQTTVSFTGYSGSNNIVNWQWYFGDGDTANTQITEHLYDTIGNFIVTLVVTDIEGCVDTIIDIITIRDVFSFYIPNAFTPNDDGFNDYFTPKGVSVDPDNFVMDIWDRWGNLMYHTDIWYNMSAEPWNGTKFNRGTISDVVLDVYVYRIAVKELDGPKHVYIGRVSLIP